MKGKVVFVLLSLFVTMVLFTACAAPAQAPTSAPTPSPSPSPAPSPAPAPSPSPTPAQPAETITWTFEVITGPGTAQYNFCEKFSNKVKEASGGRLVLELFPGGAIAPATKELEAVETGVIDCAYTSIGYNVSKIPSASILQTKLGGMTAPLMAQWYMMGGGAELSDEAIAAGGFHVQVLYPTIQTTPEVWCHSTKEIRSAADIKGLKMRTAGDGGSVMTRMGASVIMLPGGEVYESMQRGVIDAFEYSTAWTNWSMSFQEVAPYMYISNSRAPTDGCPISITQSKWDELPSELQKVLEECWRALGMENYAFDVVSDIEALDNFRNYDVVVEKLPADVDRAMLAAANEFYDEMATKDPIYAEIIESQDAFYEAVNAYHEYQTPQY